MAPLSLAFTLGTQGLGIDIGGSGIKVAVVDLETGSLVGERVRIDTPEPATPQAVCAAVAGLVIDFGYVGAVGVGFPAIVVDGVVSTANNIDDSWIGVDARAMLADVTGHQVSMVNDADAAALCEARFGVAREVDGLVIVLTFGSGIGSGVLVDGILVPNVELGGLELDGHRPAEVHFSAKARRREDLSWEEWGGRANRFLFHVNSVFSPRLIAVGGGVARKWDMWSEYIDGSLPVVRAAFANDAGLVGAATLVE